MTGPTHHGDAPQPGAETVSSTQDSPARGRCGPIGPRSRSL